MIEPLERNGSRQEQQVTAGLIVDISADDKKLPIPKVVNICVFIITVTVQSKLIYQIKIKVIKRINISESYNLMLLIRFSIADRKSVV